MRKIVLTVALLSLCELANAKVLYSAPIRNQADTVIGCRVLNTGNNAKKVTAQLYDFDHTLKHEGELSVAPGATQLVAFTAGQVTAAYCRFRVPNKKFRGYITLEGATDTNTLLIEEAH